MSKPSFLTITEQVAKYLGDEISRGRWSATLPGLRTLEAELGVNLKTVKAALLLLERDGLLVGQGAGRTRRIVLPENRVRPNLRIGMLDLDTRSRDRRLTLDLEQAPYTIVTSPKTMGDLKMDLERIKHLVKSIDVDAWVVYAGPREVLEWFSRQPLPTFAMFGFISRLPIAGAGPDSASGFAESVRHLVALGHRRIVMLTPRPTRLPEPNRAVQAFLRSLEEMGIQTGPYHLPDWDIKEGGLHSKLDTLFKHTPPTVMIINDKVSFVTVVHFLLERGIRVPGDVSLVCHEYINAFAWCEKPIAYIHWDWAPVSRRLRDWMRNVSVGKEDIRQKFVTPRFLPGRTLGPPAS